jgi:hypothetical protein
MARPLKGAGSFILVILLVYIAVKYWAQIKAALGTALNATTPASSTATLPVVNLSPGRPGDPAFSSTFGGGGNYVIPPGVGGLPGVLFSAGSNVGPLQTDESASGSPFVYINTSKYFPSGCSTHLWDRKPLCE